MSTDWSGAVADQPASTEALAAVQTLQQAALACLLADSVEAKLGLTASAVAAGLPLAADGTVPRPLPAAGRPPRPRLVAPRELAQRGFGSAAGRAAFIHAIAHIEFNAINLAWDAVYRFRGMPDAYYREWSAVAADEARHFALLQARLAATGHQYGDFDAHNGLWEMAVATQSSCLARMALVPRVLEARGLDVTPAMIDRLLGVGDRETAEVLALILREEIVHVAVGSRWFAWCCEREGVDPASTFMHLIRTHARGAVRSPFNRPARLAAGFTNAEIDGLVGMTQPQPRSGPPPEPPLTPP